MLMSAIEILSQFSFCFINLTIYWKETSPAGLQKSICSNFPPSFSVLHLSDGCDRKVLPGNDGKDDNSKRTNDDHINPKVNKLKRAAVTALSAAAVKAKLLANQEEDQIRQLASLIIEKQVL